MIHPEMRILILEDVPADAELIERELRSGGLDFSSMCVDDEYSFTRALGEFVPDVILSDYSLPGFDGTSALAVARRRAADVPFIFVTGALGEERAVELLKSGGNDFILKDKLMRLPAAVKRAVAEAEEKAKRRAAEQELRKANRELRQSHRDLERKIEERTKELKESEQRFRLIADTMPNLVWTAQSDGTIDYLNRHGLEYIGILKPESGHPCHIKPVHPDDWQATVETWRKALQTGEPCQLEQRIRRFDGAYRWFLSRCIPVRDEKGCIIKWYGTSTDIHDMRTSRDELERLVEARTSELQNAYDRLLTETRERERIEEQLRQSQKMEAVGTLAGGIAHDFNNILAAIIGNAELALDDVPEDTSAHRHLLQITKASLRARDLIKQILTFSRKSDKERKPLNLTPLVKETFKFLKASLPASIDMKLKAEAVHDVVLANPSQLQQVLMNLATNAAHAMPEGGCLDIVLHDAHFHASDPLPDPEMEPGSYVAISVCDTGYGMSEPVRQRVFEPFFTTKRPGSGVGLGLSVVYGIVKSHGGGITVASAPKKGSTFTVFLPKGETLTALQEAKRRVRMGTEKVLFVDDEAALRAAAEDMLSRLGYAVTTLADPHEALDRFQKDPTAFDVVITDYTMPGMNGLTLGKKLLEIRPGLPVILHTGYNESVDGGRAKEAGIREFLMKPFSRQELSDAMRRALDKNMAEAKGHQAL